MVEPILHEGMGMAPPLKLNLVQDSVNREARYNCRRFKGVHDERLAWHSGIDLISDAAQDADAVYAVAWGRVERIDGPSGNRTLTLRHKPFTSGYYSRYLHLGSVYRWVHEGDDVEPGRRIATFSAKGAHLHFELLRLYDPTEAIADDALNATTLDPTPLLYRFEADGWPREKNEEIERHWHRDYRLLDRLRVGPWTTEHEVDQHAAWLFEVSREGARGDYYCLPVGVGTPRQNLMIDVLRDAFAARARVRLTWRASHFFGERNMIEDVRVKYED